MRSTPKYSKGTGALGLFMLKLADQSIGVCVHKGEDAGRTSQKASTHEDDEEFTVESDSNSDHGTSDSEGIYRTFSSERPLQINTSPV